MIFLEIGLLLIACLSSFIAGGEKGYRDGCLKVLRIIENDLKDKELVHIIGTKLIKDWGK